MVNPTFGVKQVKIYEGKLRAVVKQRCLGPLMKCGALVEGEAKRSMQAGGRVKGRKTGVPSAPGDPPHVQAGALRASIAYSATMEGTVVVGPTEWYGKVHEYGGRNHPQRPFMRPALARSRTMFPRQFKDALT